MTKYKIKELFNVEKGSLQSSKNVAGSYNFITASTEWKTHESYTHECEALIFAMGAAGSLGRTHYVNDKFIASDLCFILTPRDEFKDRIELKLYYHYFNFNKEEIVKATATGTSKKAINLTNFSNHEIDYIENQIEALAKIETVLPSVKKLSTIIDRNTFLLEKMVGNILDEATKGNIVAQHPDDVKASVLLETIKNEKQRLVDEKVLKKEKSLPAIKESEKPLKLPVGWEWVRLGEITSLLGGYAFKSNSYVESSKNQVIRLGNVKNYNLILDEKQVFVSDQTAEKVESFKIREGDILLTMTGTKGKRDYFYTCLVDKEDTKKKNLYLNQRVGCLRTFNSVISKYLNFILKSNIILRTVFERETGTANQGNLGAEAIRSVLIPLPPLEEQRRIVAKIERLMNYCDGLTEEINNAKLDSDNIMKSVLQEVFLTQTSVEKG
ncbi:restriction endonuclease subunit S [Oceanobacillus caeni]|uniref:restriction endonuclease subunit S n=1 Tax=Oceanobacillus caeni TaxID=405946 RepID=UPI00362C5EC9